MAAFIRDADTVTDLFLLVLGWIGWMLWKSFRAGSWYTKHEDRLDGYDKKFAEVDRCFEEANERYSKLASAVQGMPNMWRVDLKEYTTREIATLVAEESKADRARLWSAVEDLRRARRDGYGASPERSR